MRTDHGPQYTGSDCVALGDRWGIDHAFAPVGRPTGKVVAERFIRTMNEELVWLQDWKSEAQLRTAVEQWLDGYLHRRPHQAPGWPTPAEYRAARLQSHRSHAA